MSIKDFVEVFISQLMYLLTLYKAIVSLYATAPDLGVLYSSTNNANVAGHEGPLDREKPVSKYNIWNKK